MSKPKGRRKKGIAPKPTMTDVESSVQAMDILKETGLFSEEWLERRFGPNGEMWRPLEAIKACEVQCLHATCPSEFPAIEVGKFWTWKRCWSGLKKVAKFCLTVLYFMICSLLIALCYLPVVQADKSTGERVFAIILGIWMTFLACDTYHMAKERK